MSFLHRLGASLAMLASLWVAPSFAQAPEQRFALVIGNSEYRAGRLPTAANDAGMIAETLRVAGFDVSGARDLDPDTLRRSIREFLDKVTAAGPEAVTFVYLAGYGLQFEGENYFVPIDAAIRRDEDIPLEAFRISDFIRPLGGLPGTVKLFVLDAARQHPFSPVGRPLASGLALVEPDPGMLVAFNAAPGSIAPIENGPYGAFAQSLAEMIGSGGLGLDDLFTRVRLRASEKTNGVAVPWYASKITRPFLFLERTPDAPPPPQVMASADIQGRPIREFSGDEEAYVAALARDTLTGYDEFLAAYPDSPLAPRVRAAIAVRREAIIWRRTLSRNTPDAYWSYLRRYPQGGHADDAQRRLAMLSAAADPPPAFAPIDYDVPPPPPDEVVYISQPIVVFEGPGFLPPPPIPVFFLPPPAVFIVLEPPPFGPFFLPVPVIYYVDRDRDRDRDGHRDRDGDWRKDRNGDRDQNRERAAKFVRPPASVRPPPGAPVQQITVNKQTFANHHPGSDTVASTPLPAAVVTRANAGKLNVPPLGAPPPAAIHLPMTAAVTTITPGKSPMLPPPNGLRPAGPATAMITTPPTPPAPRPPALPRPPGLATATTGVLPTLPDSMPPGLPHPDHPAAVTAPGAATTPRSPSPPAQFVNRPPPSLPLPEHAPPLPPQFVNRPPPPVEHAPPPPPQFVNRPPPPPPVMHASPPPQQFVNRPPPPPVMRAPPPPPPPPPQAAARPAPPPPAPVAAAKACVVQNGKAVCR
jgi:uncharacterized caspase-like protein